VGDEDMSATKEIFKHIPRDEFPRGVFGVTQSEWFVVGPKCLEMWWQFKGYRMKRFVDPYVQRILSEVEN
jgi:hypothetical protein